jgi:hypothetical protein
MNLKNYCAISFFVSALLVPNISSATIIDGYFKGFIYLDQSDPSLWKSNPQANTVTGYFSYDTLLAPDERDGYPGSYSSANHWLDLYFNIGGRKIDGLIEPRGDIGIQRQEGVSISDYLGGTFSVGVNSINEDDLDNYVQSYMGLDIQGIPDLLNSGSLIQNFSWKREDTYPATAILLELGERNGVQYANHLEMYITKLTVKPRHPVSVPEPSTIITLLIGLVGLVINYRRFHM